jgi:hypothetical protein
VIVVTNVKIVNKSIHNLTGVFSGVTRTTAGENWSSTANTVQYVYIPYFKVTSCGIRCSK